MGLGFPVCVASRAVGRSSEAAGRRQSKKKGLILRSHDAFGLSITVVLVHWSAKALQALLHYYSC